MGKHGCKGIPIFLRNKRTRMFSLLTALLATIAIVVGNGAINAAVYLAKKEPGLYNMGNMIAEL